jgi:hypothetical protein
MARRSLRPNLNQIRAWVRQGRTDAWIAHQLEVTVQQIAAFKRDNDLAPDDEGAAFDEVDLRAEDDALVAAELEAAAAAEAETGADEAAAAAETEIGADEAADAADDEQDEAAARPRGRRRSRGRRGGRARGKDAAELEGTFDHGEEGYGLWLDPSIQDDPVYAEHWAGHRPVTVTVLESQIVIRRAGDDGEDEDE